MPRVALVLALVVLVAVFPALAQDGNGRPAQGDGNARRSLSASATVAQGLDNHAHVEPGVSVDPSGLGIGGPSTMISGSLAYAWRMGAVKAGTTVATSSRHYYQYSDDFRVVNGGIGISAPLSRRTSLVVNQTASYAPSYLYGLFPQLEAVTEPGATEPIPSDYFVDDRESISFETSAVLAHRLTRRSSLSVQAGWGRTHFAETEVTRRDLQTYGADSTFEVKLSRNVELHARYRYRNADYAFGTVFAPAMTSAEHTVDAGMNYSRPLSSLRIVSFGAAVGGSKMSLPPAASNLPLAGGGAYEGFSGEGSMTYQFARTWAVRGAYRKGPEYVAGLTEPLLADSVSVGTSGRLSPKMHVSASLGYSTGSSAVRGDALTFVTYTGNARLGYALGRPYEVFAEYLYYFYNFEDGRRFVLAPTVPEDLERVGVRAGLRLALPIIKR